MFYAIVAIVIFVSIMAFLSKKKLDGMIGRGMGSLNNEKWGMDDQDQKYHDESYIG